MSFIFIELQKLFLLRSRLNFWDLGGQEELQALWDKYFAECHAIIYTVDSNDRERVQESKKSFDIVIKNENLKGVPLLLLANKQDLPGKIEWRVYILSYAPTLGYDEICL